MISKTTEILDKALRDPVLFVKYILASLPFELSGRQKHVLRTFYSGSYYEALWIFGRKSGKDVLAAIVNLKEMTHDLQLENPQRHYKMPARKTKIWYMNIAPTKDQAENILFDYICSFAEDSWYLSEFIEKQTTNELHFVNDLIIRAQGSSARAGLGYAIRVLNLDEIGHFVDTKTGNASGTQVYNRLVPNTLPFKKNRRIISISSPAAKSGILWDLHEKVLEGKAKWIHMDRAPTWEMNPEYPFDPITKTGCDFLVDRYNLDPYFFWMEYGAEFADVINPFFVPKKIDACCTGEMLDVLNTRDKHTPRAVTLDPATKGDRYSLAMGHVDRHGKPIVDYVTYWEGDIENPVLISEVEAFVDMLHENFWIYDVALDQHQSASTIQRKKRKWRVRETVFSGPYNMEIYQNLFELTNIENIVLPNYRPLKIEMKMLQRKEFANRFKVEAATGYHDDLPDTVANLAYILTVKPKGKGRMARAW